MSFIEKMKSQLSRIFGLDFSGEMTDAEVLDKLEGIESISELRAEVSEQKGTIDDQNTSLQSLQKSYDEVSDKIKSLASTEQIDALSKSISEFKTSVGQELNALKSQDTTADTTSGGPKLPETQERKTSAVKGSGSFVTKRFQKGQINN